MSSLRHPGICHRASRTRPAERGAASSPSICAAFDGFMTSLDGWI
jgi:hypothetical protein